MKKLLTISVLCIAALSLYAQDNLVMNPGFEEASTYKYGVYKVKHGKSPITSWYAPLSHTPTLFIAPKKSVAVANGGSNAIGLLLGSSRQDKTKFEYITGKLKKPLEKGKTYCICFNTILHRTSRWAATEIGVLLHQDKKVLSDISDPSSMTASLYADRGEAVINTKWQKYCGYYVAAGGEQYISFGKFGDDPSIKMKDLGLETHYETDNYQSKAFYQLDDLSVKELKDSADCGCAEKPSIVENEERDSIEIEPSYPPYLFALDASGSMKKDGLFDTLRENLSHFVSELPDGTPVTFVTFASTSRKVFAGVKGPNTSYAVDSLLSLSPVGGGTNVFLGLQLAYESWDTEGADSARLVFISDGEFHVTPKITSIVKNQYETEGRKLTLIQIGARASGLQQLEPYMDDYIYTTESEISVVVSQLQKSATGGPKGIGGAAVACGCEEEYSKIMNYHFVIDYSGSMAQEKTRAIMALRYLFDKAPENAMISVTAFNTSASELYVGKKTDITMAQLSIMLGGKFTGGGTDPVPGVQHALELAKTMSDGRFSHVILITDYSAMKLSRLLELGQSMRSSMKAFDLAGCAITVDSNGIIATHSQFDETTANFVGVGRMQFEKDLFYTQRSSCNYTSQPYHYNPSKAVAKTATKKVLGKVFVGVVKGSISM